jgi:hypothetical protein
MNHHTKHLVLAAALALPACHTTIEYVGLPVTQPVLDRISDDFATHCGYPMHFSQVPYTGLSEDLFPGPDNLTFGFWSLILDQEDIYPLSSTYVLYQPQSIYGLHGSNFATGGVYIGLEDPSPELEYHVLLHELGHEHGLQHVEDTENLMYPSVKVGSERSALTEDQWTTICTRFHRKTSYTLRAVDNYLLSTSE